ncbi:hypothetical protein JGH11_00505 [Dysgonomonas sp. Marseille-P4677]|uniref:hypothetical protein n=1 Tax=Dysgonomonas sp. Marseille-P4677 TaxID=2364790 RepID=UPI00191220D6|nr:hypothetical protein [Dysgonomonas sp. Marseille-P4677]MBK5719340.1 hypothetical protein [Dysgonomonas sp. Marseille-P4677]
MTNNDDDLKNKSPLDNRLGAPMKKVDGLSCDKKKSESEHLHAFREDIYIGNSKEGKQEENDL